MKKRPAPVFEVQRGYLLERMQELQDSLDFIDRKQSFYDDVLEGKIPYTSNLIDVDEKSA